MNLKSLVRPAVLSLGLAMWFSAAPADAAPLKKAEVNLAIGGTSAQLYFLPLILADQLGYFSQEGLKVNLIDTGSGTKGLQALVSGGADVTAGSFEHSLRMQARGQDVVAFVKFGRFLGNVLAITSKRAASYKSPADMKGWTVGVSSPGSSSYMFVTLLLAKNGIKPDEVSFIALGQGAGGVAAVRTGKQIDAVSLTDPTISELESTKDVVVVADSRALKGTIEVYGGESVAGVLYTTKDFLTKYPDTIQALTNAIVRALKWIKASSIDEVMAKVPESYIAGRPALYKMMLEKSIESYQTDGSISTESIDTMMNYMKMTDEEVRNAKFDPSSAFNGSFVKKANVIVGDGK